MSLRKLCPPAAVAVRRSAVRATRERRQASARAASSASASDSASAASTTSIRRSAYSRESWTLLDTTCARLMRYPDKPPPAGYRLIPEVATGFPKVSADGKTYTFTLRKGFRFSDGSPVRAERVRPGDRPHARARRQVAGAPLHAGDRRRRRRPGRPDAQAIRGHGPRPHARRPVHAGGPRLRRLDDDAVLLRGPADAPAQPGGRATASRSRSLLRPGVRPRTTGRAPPQPLLRRHACAPRRRLRRRSQRRLARADARPDRVRQGGLGVHAGRSPPRAGAGPPAEVRRTTRSGSSSTPASRFGCTCFNSARPLFRDNPKLRLAVNLALDRTSLSQIPAAGRWTDQYIPETVPGHVNRFIHPLGGDLAQAKALADGNTRGGKAVLYVTDFTLPREHALLLKQQLAPIGLDVEIKPFGEHVTSTAYLGRLGIQDEPWDLALVLWTPDFVDPSGYINQALDTETAGGDRSRGLRRGELPRAHAPGYSPARRGARAGLSRPQPVAGARGRAARSGRRPQRGDSRLGAGRLRPAAALARPHHGMPRGLVAAVLLALVLVQPGSTAGAREGGIFRVSFQSGPSLIRPRRSGARVLARELGAPRHGVRHG